MPIIDKILSRITVLYYIFIAVLMLDFGYSFYSGFTSGLQERHQKVSQGCDAIEHLPALIWSSISILAYIATIVMFVILLVSLGKSITRKNPFNLSTVRWIHAYTIVYGVSLLTMFISQLFGELGSITLHDILITTLSGATTIVLLLLFAQMIKIGNILKAEQDLTI